MIDANKRYSVRRQDLAPVAVIFVLTFSCHEIYFVLYFPFDSGLFGLANF